MSVNLCDYIEDDLLCIYLNNFNSDELEEFVSHLNKCGYIKEVIKELFLDLESFIECYDEFLRLFD
jgi:hypothetical protein|tara:strand:+ start:261 stop:458 length:198 start_codon:yes stop_codon:yes gene_type:complete